MISIIFKQNIIILGSEKIISECIIITVERQVNHISRISTCSIKKQQCCGLMLPAVVQTGQAAGGKERQLATQPLLSNGFAGGGERPFCYPCFESLRHWWQHAAVSASDRSCSGSATPPGCCTHTSCSQKVCCVSQPSIQSVRKIWRDRLVHQERRRCMWEGKHTRARPLSALSCGEELEEHLQSPIILTSSQLLTRMFLSCRKQPPWGQRVASGVRALWINATEACPFSTAESHWSPLCIHHRLPKS